MKAIGPILSALLLTSTVVVAPTFWTTEVRAQVSVGKMAQEVTVWIRGVDNAQNFGSGVIVARSGKTYTVLTAFHVVDNSDQYTIRAPDGIDYPLKNIQRFPNADMATVQFDSGSSYTLAKLGNSDTTDLATSAYVAGYPKAGLNVDAVFTLTKGEVSAIIPKNQAKDGYGIAYSTLTRAGMSGGPVFNDSGEVIAIHGRKESERDGQNIAGGWLNLGVPINRYKAGGSGGGATVDYRAAAEAQRKAEAQRAAQAAQQQAEAQRKVEAERLAQAESQRKAEAERLAQAEAQRKAEAQRLAQAEAQRKAEAQRLAEAQKQAEARKQAEAQRAAQAQQAETQRKAEVQRLAEAQKQAEARRAAQAAQQQTETQQKAQAPRSKLMALTSMQPLAAPIAEIKPAAIAPPKKVCEKIRINTIVTERCTTVGGTPEPGVTLESGRNQTSKDSPEYYIASGNQSTTSGRLDSAIADYSKAIQRDSSSGIAYFNRGLAYLKKGQSSDATSDFTRAAELFRSAGDSSNLRKTEEILGELGRA
jgi:hypothetical protein